MGSMKKTQRGAVLEGREDGQCVEILPWRRTLVSDDRRGYVRWMSTEISESFFNLLGTAEGARVSLLFCLLLLYTRLPSLLLFLLLRLFVWYAFCCVWITMRTQKGKENKEKLALAIMPLAPSCRFYFCLPLDSFCGDVRAREQVLQSVLLGSQSLNFCFCVKSLRCWKKAECV